MPSFRYNNEKAIAAVLYISKKVDGIRFHKLFKILYFAELKHLAKYGRPIVGDQYAAMEDGPVPSTIYDFLKQAGNIFRASKFKAFFDVSVLRTVQPKTEPDMDQFSETDIACLDQSIEENKKLSWAELKAKSHDFAWTKAWSKRKGKKEDMSVDDIIKVSGASEEIKEYMAQVDRYNAYKVA